MQPCTQQLIRTEAVLALFQARQDKIRRSEAWPYHLINKIKDGN